MIKSFTSTAFQRNPADVFNAVQSEGIATIAHKARPEMIVELNYKGDRKNQLDLLKG